MKVMINIFHRLIWQNVTIKKRNQRKGRGTSKKKPEDVGSDESDNEPIE